MSGRHDFATFAYYALPYVFISYIQRCTSQPDSGSAGSRHKGHSKSTDLVKVTIKVRPNSDMKLILDNSRVLDFVSH